MDLGSHVDDKVALDLLGKRIFCSTAV